MPYCIIVFYEHEENRHSTALFILGGEGMEQFDILDKNGNTTGLVANKGSQLSSGQYYLGTHAYIFNSSLEFLIQQRSYNKEFLPGGWDVHLEHSSTDLPHL